VSPRVEDRRDRTRLLILLLSLWSLAISLLARIYVFIEVPLPPDHPIPWLLGAIAQDVAVLGALAAICLLAPRYLATQIAARVLFTVSTIVITVLQIVRGEAVIFFGAAVRPEDLHRDIRVTVLMQSISGFAAALLVATALTLPFVLWVWDRDETPSASRRLRLRTLVPVVIVAGLVAALAERFVNGEGLARNPVVAIAMIEREMKVGPTARFEKTRPHMPLTAIRDFVPADLNRHYFDPNYPLAYLPGKTPMLVNLPPDAKPNIVLVVMESVRASEVGCYGGQPPYLTPNLDALARKGIRVDDMFSTATLTASGELAVFYGLPPIPREVLITSRPATRNTGLPDILRAAGWNSMLWLHSGDLDFYGRDVFYLPRGFRVVDARAFPKSDPSTNWGYSDRSLARHAITALSRAKPPFAAMVLTVSNHHMFQLPSDAGPRVPIPPHEHNAKHIRVDDMLQTVHYTDEAVGDFMRLAAKEPWFHNTIFVFTGDHGLTLPQFQRTTKTQQQLWLDLLHRVPLIIYSPMITTPMVIHGPASHVDIMPTVLALANVQRPRTGIGINLLRQKPPEDRIVVLWGTHGQSLMLVSKHYIYDASYLLDTPIETLIADEKAKAVLDTDIPGLSSHPALDQFKSMSLKAVQPFSNGALTDEMLKKVETDLAAIK